MFRFKFELIVLAAVLCAGFAESADLPDEARDGLRRAVTYMHGEVAVNGGYVYFVTPDGKDRWGEGAASKTQIWVQPPGTPRVGMALINAYEATKDTSFLDAANAAGEALMFGQLKSGCWAHAIDFSRLGRRSGDYRNGKGRGKNNSTLDDDASQAALRFMISLDKAQGFKNERVHEATEFGLNALLNAQFANGGFPQVWSGPVEERPVKKASYPDYDWRTENRVKEYWHLYTLNDNLAGDVAKTLILAHNVYKDDRFMAALRRLGDFLILAQMPDPQPAWCQQYTRDMKPAWARKFEPPAVVSSESQDVMRALMIVYGGTGDKKYLAPIPKALDYLEASKLDDGRLPRYFELRSNKPLYMKAKIYKLTYSDENLPTHYAFKISPSLDRIRNDYEKLVKNGPPKPSTPSAKSLEPKVRQILKDLDDKGRWITVVGKDKRLAGQPKVKDGTKR
jgi:hypothetical protein